jgi:hypothetical protein
MATRAGTGYGNRRAPTGNRTGVGIGDEKPGTPKTVRDLGRDRSESRQKIGETRVHRLLRWPCMNGPPRVEVALQLLKDVYLSDPALVLTVDQAAALTNLELYVCRAIMEALADASFLRRSDVAFVRNGGSRRAER